MHYVRYMAALNPMWFRAPENLQGNFLLETSRVMPQK